MDDRHFHFVRNAGMFHHLIEDVPHGLVGVARLVIMHMPMHECMNDRSSWAGQILDGDFVTYVSTFVSIVSIVFGLFNKSIQLLVLRAGTSSHRESALASVDSLRRSFGGIVAATTASSDLNERLMPGGEATSLGGSE